MGKALRYQELPVVASSQEVAFPLLVGRRALADVDDHVQYRPGDDPDQLGLRRFSALEVQPPQDAGLRRQRVVVLNEVKVDPSGLEVAVGVTFGKETPVVAEDGRRDQLNVL